MYIYIWEMFSAEDNLQITDLVLGWQFQNAVRFS